MPTYKLYYFNMKGRGEAIRLIFAQAGVPFEDYRFKEGEWPTYKEKTPMGQAPVLEVDGKQLCQSLAIARYLAKQFGLQGSNDWEAAQCDMLSDGFQDVVGTMRPWFIEKDEAKKAEILANLKKEHFIPFADRYEKILAANPSGFYVGDKVTWLDLVLFALEEWWSGMLPDVMGAHPKMKAHMEKIAALPNIKKWLETRPQTAM